MKKRTKLFLSLGAVTSALTLAISASCSTKNDDRNPGLQSFFRIKKTDYDLGLVTEPINSLNYIKFSSLARVLPSLVESPLKGGPNEKLKKELNLPEIPFGIYGLDDTSNSMEEYLENHSAPSSNAGRFYSLEQFGATTGNISSDSSEYQPVQGIFTNSNNILSLTMLLNEGNSKWSNGDKVFAEDYVDALHYILDLNTGSQNQTNVLKSKIRASSEVIDAQQTYLRKFGKAYQNPFAYPELIKNEKGELIYDVLNPKYQPWTSQNEGDEAEVAAIKKTALDLGLVSGRLYWNYSNEEILSAIPYSPDFDPNAEITTVMLTNPDYSPAKHSEEELKNIPQRLAVQIRKYLYSDPRQEYGDSFQDLIRASRRLRDKLPADLKYTPETADNYNALVNAAYKGENVLNNESIVNFKAKSYRKNRVLAMDEYSLRVEYDQFQPASLDNVYRDLTSNLVPINRKFVESIGGITQFGLSKETFLTNGAFNLDDLELGAQGYISLAKNKEYYSADKTISNKINIFFSADPNINAAMYDDGYIAATRIPAVQQLTYWTSKAYRPFMTKSTGFGTIGLAFNLDKETNGNSLLNDRYLRNAIYYAIDRNQVLNIVGWNSSYPVITWTAFGNAASSFGDPLEVAFDHDYSLVEKYPEGADRKIPVQNYTHLDHLSKRYNFEYLERDDKAYRLDVARAYLEAFKEKHPDVKSVKLKYISNSTDEHQNAGLALQDLLKKAFGNFIEIEIKGLPENVYEDARTKGDYDILYRNFDSFGTDVYSYVDVFLKTDEINKSNNKNTGFRNNPAGSWTYETYFSEFGYKYDKTSDKVISDKPELVSKLKERLRVDDDVFEKVLELSFKKDDESIADYTKRTSAFFSNQFTDEEKTAKWTEKRVFAVITAMEKIIRDGAPVVPLIEVDTYWEISRVNGVDSLFRYSLQFAYDIFKPPRPNLPKVIKDSN
ncbi:oligopeptide abc transporter, substrate-bindingprotein (oppa), lipoprotein [Mycoplasmopsis columbina SF7]|uniref:Oligopeptide abc transporter, substrate-bindingprotein (Oppa), lipoprotein n=1 Tax=Mycoplasmopsis columbina SF7 TaxID=1037410 RepID=F9UJE2_9BACT|nr:ABC transporter substrate-binding protein [Mycoplasmopsis columbina]EGV00485.1 oligopeptide abc transporter, substrate-bindingprotein (oppa), lipoprotein [Mycoplasmopsis columbina SF7]